MHFRLSILKTGTRLAHEADCVYLTNACVILLNVCLMNGDNNEEDVVFDDEHDLECEKENISNNTHPEKRQRYALYWYFSRSTLSDELKTLLKLRRTSSWSDCLSP